MDADPSLGMVYFAATEFHSEAHPIVRPVLPRWEPTRHWLRKVPDSEPLTSFTSIFYWAPLMEPVAVLRRNVFDTTTRWSEANGQPGKGFDLFLQMADRAPVHYIDKAFYHHRIHSQQSTADGALMDLQMRRCYDRWRQVPIGVSVDITLHRSALAFRECRLLPFLGMQAAGRALRRGSPLLAVRCLLGAVKAAGREMLRRRSRP